MMYFSFKLFSFEGKHHNFETLRLYFWHNFFFQSQMILLYLLFLSDEKKWYIHSHFEHKKANKMKIRIQSQEYMGWDHNLC